MAYPVSVGPSVFNAGNGHWIVADAELDNQGNVTVTVHLTCTNKVVAMIGGIQLAYYDANNNKLGESTTANPFTLKCGPAPLIGAAHTSGSWGDKAPNGTARLLLGQVCSDDYGPILGFFEEIVNVLLQALGDGGGPSDGNLPAGTPDGEVDDLPVPTLNDPNEEAKLQQVQLRLSLSKKA